MRWIVALWACGGPADEAPADLNAEADADTDADTDTDTDSDADTDTADTSGVGATASTAETGSVSTGTTADTGSSACPDGTPPTETGLIRETGLPTSSCDLPAAVYPVNPGPVVTALSIHTARIDGDVDRLCGSDVASLGDNDGDGLGEIAVGCPGYNRPGEVWVFVGGVSGVRTRGDAVSILTQGTYSHYPHGDGELLEVGSLTGVAPRDLVVAGYSDNAAYVLPLPVPVGVRSLDTAAAVVEPILFRLPSGIPTVGDYNGDGVDDLALSGREPETWDTPPGLGDGGVSVYLGPLSGVLDPILDADVQLEISAIDHPWGVTHRDWSGTFTEAFVGDVDGDGTSDILFGGDAMANYAPPPSVEYGVGAFDEHGGVALFPSGPLGRRSASDTSSVLYGTCFTNLNAEFQAPVGDVTGDCVADVATVSFGSHATGAADAGAVFLLSGDRLRRARGHVSILRIAGAVIFGEARNDGLSRVSTLGDLNQDGHGDLVLGAPEAVGHRGRVYIFLGPLVGHIHASDADLVIEGKPGDELFGYAVKNAGDVDGDGIQDLVVGASQSGWNGVNSGSAWIFSGADLLAAM